jgi:hypothetical protein
VVGHDDAGRLDAAAALSALAEPLLPHLRGEEDDVMPLVSATLTDTEWRAWDQQHNVRGKSLSQLAAEGHWLMDGLDPDRRDVLLHLVPAPARIVIVKGYARRYRAACARRWGPERERLSPADSSLKYDSGTAAATNGHGGSERLRTDSPPG